MVFLPITRRVDPLLQGSRLLKGVRQAGTENPPLHPSGRGESLRRYGFIRPPQPLHPSRGGEPH